MNYLTCAKGFHVCELNKQLVIQDHQQQYHCDKKSKCSQSQLAWKQLKVPFNKLNQPSQSTFYHQGFFHSSIHLINIYCVPDKPDFALGRTMRTKMITITCSSLNSRRKPYILTADRYEGIKELCYEVCLVSLPNTIRCHMKPLILFGEYLCPTSPSK